MLRNYFNIARRNLWKHKFFSLINVIGLAIGIAACLLIFSFIRYEKGFDKNYPSGIYRLVEVQQNNGTDTPQKIARTMFPMGSTLKSDFPEVAGFARIISLERVPLQQPGTPAVMATWAGADASLLRVFNLKLVRGDESSALTRPGTIILTEKLATELFGSRDPLGLTVRNQGRDTTDYIVTGVLQNMPEQSHLQADAFYSFSTELIAGENKDWENDWMFTYLTLQKGADPEALEAKLPAYLNKYMGPEKAKRYQLLLQPIGDIHLWSGEITQEWPGMRKFNGNYLAVLAATALLVLALAIINYVNLTTARSITRAREIAVRKTIGAGRMQIAFQFLGETSLLTLIAMIIAFAVTDMCLPMVNTFSGSDIPLRIWSDPSLLIAGAGIALATGLCAGLIPAASLATLQPVSVLRGRFWTSSRSPLRNALVVAQFAIAVSLSVASVSAFRQLEFMRKYDLGFDKEAVLVTQVSWAERHRVQALMDELRAIPGVNGVTGSLRRLGNPIDQVDAIFQEQGKIYPVHAATMYVDYNYIPFYKIELVAGRNISAQFGSDAQGNSYLINESMARKLLEVSGQPQAPLSTLIGKQFRYSFQDLFGTIVGITRDFNFSSLHHKVEPLSLTYEFDYYFKDLSLRIDSRRKSETVALIADKWKQILPDQQFDYYFLDNYIDQLYRADTNLGQLVTALTVLALFISALGLIGLASYNTERRTKEIGVRKVLGASVQSIVALLSKDFIKLVIIAVAIGIPVAWWAVAKWLEDFAYRIQISGWIFFGAALAVILLAMATVCYQSIKAALMNPVKSLRSE